MSNQEEDRELLFKCSETGNKFRVTFRRRSTSHKFRIIEISDDITASSDRMFGEAIKMPSSSTPQLPQGSDARHPTTSGSTSSIQDFEVTDFDFSGWYCPCCKFAHPYDTRPVYHQFVYCYGCNEYVCGASMRQIGDGVILFECCGGCPGGGVVKGEITSYTGLEVKPDTRLSFPSEKKEIERPATSSQQIRSSERPFLLPPKEE